MNETVPVLLMTRPREASEAFVTALERVAEIEFTAVISPLIGVSTCGTLPDMSRYAGVIFTSANGVAAYRALGGPVVAGCYVVGASTATAARDAGFTPVSAEGDAAALVQLVRRLSAKGPLLHLRGTHARGDVAGRLGIAGTETHEAIIYDQPPMEMSDEAKATLSDTAPVVVPLFSPRSAARFAAQGDIRAPLLIAAMSQAIWQEVVDLRAIQNIVTAEPTGEAMQKAALYLLGLARTLESRQDAQ